MSFSDQSVPKSPAGRVSVVIPAYKAAQTICRAVDSIRSQTVPAHEIIVVDDGSPDDVADVVSRTFGSQVILIRKTNGGVSTARNVGIERATGDFVAFLDADDHWEPEKLERQLEVFAKHPEVQIVAGRYYTCTEGAPREPGATIPADWCDRILTSQGAEAFLIATLVWTGATIVRRDILQKNRFDETLRIAEDIDLWVRLTAKYATYLLSEPTATYLIYPNSLSHSCVDREGRDMLNVVQRHRKLLGPIATRQWSARIWHHLSVGGKEPGTAMSRLLKSLVLWPLPFPASVYPQAQPLIRLKRFGALLRSLLVQRTA